MVVHAESALEKKPPAASDLARQEVEGMQSCSAHVELCEDQRLEHRQVVSMATFVKAPGMPRNQ